MAGRPSYISSYAWSDTSSDTRGRPEMTTTAVKTRETRLRRMAKRQGLRLHKSRRRDPHASDYGVYALVDEETSFIVAGADSGRFGFSLDDVETHLKGERV
jgi:hypothetical protein